MKPITYNYFYKKRFQMFPPLRKLYKTFKRLIRPGRLLKVVLSLRKLPFEVAVFLKVGKLRSLLRFIPVTFIRGVCVSTTFKQLASSFTVRSFTKDGFVDRRLLLFSPRVIRLIKFKPHKNKTPLKFKKKLFFLNKANQKKFFIHANLA